MEIYFIISVSFAIMFTFQYTYQINRIVLDTLDMFDIDYRETRWDPFTYGFVSFVTAIIAMPIFLLSIIAEERWGAINKASKHILDKHFSKYFKK